MFLNIQQQKQQTLFDFDSEVSTSVEGEFLTKDVIKERVKQHLLKENNDRRYTEFIATFVNDYGLCCDFAMIHDILDELEERKEIEIIRNPAYTKTGLKRKFWEEKENHTITIRRL